MPDPISWSFTGPYLAAALLIGYLAGSIPFALILTRRAGLGDIRTKGSGNIGATNVLRYGGRTLALWTLVLDAAKGAVPVLLAGEFGPDMAVVAGGGAFLGHLFPVWLRFRGGKGVATGLGVLLALSWPVGLLACATWLITALVFRFSSLAGLAAFAAAPVYAWFLADRQRFEFALFLAVLVFFRHYKNIGRLVQGNEGRLTLGRKDGKSSTHSRA